MMRVLRHYVPLGTFFEIAADVAIYFTAFLLALLSLKSMYAEHLVPLDIAMAVALALVMTGLSGLFGLYRQEELAFGPLVMRSVAATVLGASVLYGLVLLLAPAANMSLGAIRLTVPYALLALIIFHRALLAIKGRRIGVPRVLVVGNGAEADNVLSVLSRADSQRVTVTGVYLAGESAQPMTAATRIFPRSASLWSVVKEQQVNEVIVAVRERRGGVLPLRDLLECRVHGVRVTDETGFYERMRGEFPIESLKVSWLIYGQGFEQGWLRSSTKRLFDIVTSSILLMIAAPVMLITAVLIKLESPGPIVYRQTRVGLGGRPFICPKFRSMCADAERDGVARWAQKGDSRITRIGRFIRMTRIDELPQLFNVLKGEMSLVGPRPERPGFVDELKKDIPFYDVRHSVKPGLTGWAQVRFTYASTLEESKRKLQFDLYYVKNHSLLMDLMILLETVRVVLMREGAK